MPTYPYTIDNGSGESLTFLRIASNEGGSRLEVEGRARPGAGPPMHVHYLQEEAITVVAGRMGYQVEGGPPQYAEAGDTVLMAPGIAHKWWNAGSDELVSTGWMRPPLNGEYFLAAIFASMKRAGRKQPGMLDAAFLMTRYRSEFNIVEIPAIVQKVGFPLLVVIGRLLGAHLRYANAPEPIPAP